MTPEQIALLPLRVAPKQTKAAVWLAMKLAGGQEYQSRDLVSQAAVLGIDSRMLNRAAKMVGAVKKKRYGYGYGGRWVWKIEGVVEADGLDPLWEDMMAWIEAQLHDYKEAKDHEQAQKATIAQAGDGSPQGTLPSDAGESSGVSEDSDSGEEGSDLEEAGQVSQPAVSNTEGWDIKES